MNWLMVGSLMAALSVTTQDPGDQGGLHGPQEMILGADLLDHPELWTGVRVAEDGGLRWDD